MKVKKIVVAAAMCGATLMLCSCNTRPADWEDGWVTQDIVASPAAAEQVRIDGEISEGEWNDTQEYQLSRAQDWGYEKLLPRQRKREDTTPFERGYFKVKYDADFLYVLAVLDDEHIVQTSREDQTLSYETGDMIEVFLKPEDKCAFWEIYGTPWNNVTTIFYPWAGYSRFDQKFVPGIKAAALARPATDPEKDKPGWAIEMAIPRTLIEQTGGVFAPDKEWRILLCRYNFGKNLPNRQISSAPRLPRTNHRMTEYYAKLKFKPMPEGKEFSGAKPAVGNKKDPEVNLTDGYDREPEVKPAAGDKNAPETKPAAEEKKDAEVKPGIEQKKPEVKPATEQKKPEVKPATEQKKPEAKPATEQKKPEAKPASEQKKSEAKPASGDNKTPAGK